MRMCGVGVFDSEEPVGQMSREQRAAFLESVPKAQVLLFCPVCCSPDEREVRDGVQITVTCGQCGQVFALGIDLTRIEEHS